MDNQATPEISQKIEIPAIPKQEGSGKPKQESPLLPPTEQNIVTRIKQDGDPDQVLEDVAGFSVEKQAKNTSRSLTEVLGSQMETRAIPVSNAGKITEAIVFPKKEMPTEKTVRVYRGVTKLDEKIIIQTPYAMRAEEETGGVRILEDIREEVDRLANEPNYENLIVYVDKVRPNLNKQELGRLEDALLEIEDGVLAGRSVRQEITFQQIYHTGGSADSGISPYISASFNPEQAAGYSRGEALLVIDIPISRIEAFPTSDETYIKGNLDKGYISAVIPLCNEKEAKNLNNALEAVNESLGLSGSDPAETQRLREEEFAKNQTKDREQWQRDTLLVRQKRTANLVGQFPELDFSQLEETSKKSGVDIYTSAKRTIFDTYATRFQELTGGRDVESEDYFPKKGLTKKFDRDNITDEMLVQLQGLVVRREQRRNTPKLKS